MHGISKFKNISESYVNYYETIHNNHILVLYPTLVYFLEKYFELTRIVIAGSGFFLTLNLSCLVEKKFYIKDGFFLKH